MARALPPSPTLLPLPARGLLPRQMVLGITTLYSVLHILYVGGELGGGLADTDIPLLVRSDFRHRQGRAAVPAVLSVVWPPLKPASQRWAGQPSTWS